MGSCYWPAPQCGTILARSIRVNGCIPRTSSCAKAANGVRADRPRIHRLLRSILEPLVDVDLSLRPREDERRVASFYVAEPVGISGRTAAHIDNGMSLPPLPTGLALFGERSRSLSRIV